MQEMSDAEVALEATADEVAEASGERQSVFDKAVDLVEYLCQWVDWTRPDEVRTKPVASALSWLETTDFGGLADDLKKVLFEELIRKDAETNYPSVVENITSHIERRRVDLTAFIKENVENVDLLR